MIRLSIADLVLIMLRRRPYDLSDGCEGWRRKDFGRIQPPSPGPGEAA
jgi:hypothetical protein